MDKAMAALIAYTNLRCLTDDPELLLPVADVLAGTLHDILAKPAGTIPCAA